MWIKQVSSSREFKDYLYHVNDSSICNIYILPYTELYFMHKNINDSKYLRKSAERMHRTYIAYTYFELCTFISKRLNTQM